MAGLTVLAFFFLLSIALSNIAVRNTNKMMPNITWWSSISSSTSYVYIIMIITRWWLWWRETSPSMLQSLLKGLPSSGETDQHQPYQSHYHNIIHQHHDPHNHPLFWWDRSTSSQYYSSCETDKHHLYQHIITIFFINDTNINIMVHITTPSSGETAICNIVINIILFDLITGWQKLRGSTGGTRRKVWTRTKILSPNIRYFVAN